MRPAREAAGFPDLPSLQTYLLVEQGTITVDCLELELPLAEVYADVRVPASGGYQP